MEDIVFTNVCPKCGNKDISTEYGPLSNKYWCVCKKCKLRGPFADSEKDSIIAWNKMKKVS